MSRLSPTEGADKKENAGQKQRTGDDLGKLTNGIFPRTELHKAIPVR
jgi:hypothetical protein